LSFQNGGAVDRLSLEGRGYVGLFRQNVLVLRALRDAADTPLPPYLKPMLGGMANLRGFKAGTAIGDMLVAASAELRVPLTSPLSFGKIGVSAFVDAGTAYDKRLVSRIRPSQRHRRERVGFGGVLPVQRRRGAWIGASTRVRRRQCGSFCAFHYTFTPFTHSTTLVEQSS
jgi:outer membrane protein assembly factor BamA